MAKRGQSKIDVAREYLARFPQAATQTLAKKAYAENPALWPTLNACDLSFRQARGTHGKKHRKSISHVARPQEAADALLANPFGKIPDGVENMPGWGPLQLEPPLKALIVSDLHVPYHHRPTYELACRVGLDHGVDTVLLNGDILDCFALSRWETDPRERKFAVEISRLHELLSATGEIFSGARKLLKLGNHEERYWSYMQLKAPELLDVAEFQFSSILHLAELGWEEVTDRRPIRLGTLNVIHGHEYRFAISNPVNPARGLFLRAKNHAVCGHFHQSSHHPEATLEGKVISCWSVGCCCDLHPRYMPLNKWNHGFAVVDVDADGGFSMLNYRVIRGKVYT